MVPALKKLYKNDPEEYKKALSYFDKYIVYSDSVQDITQSEVIRKIHALYNYQYKEKENNRLQHLANNYQKWNIIFISSLFVLTLLFATYRQYRKRKEQSQLIQQEKFKKIQEQIKKLEYFLQEAEKEKNQLRQDLLKSQKVLIEKTNEQIAANQKVQEQSEINLKHSDIYKKFHLATETNSGKIKSNDWQELAYVVDETYNQFTKRLLGLYPMKTIEIQVCLLIKIGLSPTQIAFITIRTKQAITSIRKRLYKRRLPRTMG